MPFIQQSTPPPNKILNFSLKSFSGGLNNRSDQIGDSQATSTLNMMFADETLMEKRYGQKYYDITDVLNEIVFIDEFKPYTYDNVLIRATNDLLYIEDDVLTDIQGKPCGINHQGMYFFVDGDKFYVYGHFDQQSSTYRKVIGTAIDDFVLLEVVSPPDDHARLDTTHVRGVLNINYTDYTVYYEPCENEMTDNFKGANKVPENLKYLVSHNGRIFASGNKRDNDNVFISDVHNAFYFPVSLPIQLPPNSDEVKGLAIYDNSVIVGREYDIYAIHGSTNRTDMNVEPFSLRKLNTHTGLANNDCFNIAHNYLFFLGSDGNAYSLESSRIDSKNLASQILSRNIDIDKAPISVDLSFVKTACSKFHDDKWYLSIGDKVLVYSYKHMAWTMYNNIDAKYFYTIDNKLIWGTSNGRTVTFDEENFMDFGLPYEAHWHSKIFDMEDANSFKQFREFFLLAHTYTLHPSDIQILFEVDYEDVKERAIVSNQISAFGRSKWGDRFVTRNISESLPIIIGRRGRTIKFKLKNGWFVHDSVATYNDLLTYIGRSEDMLIHVIDENKYYVYTNKEWLPINQEDFNQRMKIYQVNGDYELRGKR